MALPPPPQATDGSPYVTDQAIGSGGVILPRWVGDAYASATINAAQGTTPVTLITGAPGYYVTRLLVEVLPNATMTSAGMVNVTFSDSVLGTLGQLPVYLPATFTAPTVPTVATPQETGSGFLVRSKNSGSTLSVSVNNALSGGSIRVAVNYGLTPIL